MMWALVFARDLATIIQSPHFCFANDVRAKAWHLALHPQAVTIRLGWDLLPQLFQVLRPSCMCLSYYHQPPRTFWIKLQNKIQDSFFKRIQHSNPCQCKACHELRLGTFACRFVRVGCHNPDTERTTNSLLLWLD